MEFMMPKAERQHAAREIAALACGTRLSSDMVDALVDWHVAQVAAAKAQAWIPGTGENADPRVEEVVKRFYLHGLQKKIFQLQNENRELAGHRKNFVECARFYADGAWDGGAKARLALECAGRPKPR
jgi:hypothetical protein